jgi:hypothetical protein
MAIPTFDTLKFVTRLKESGLSEGQAVAITEAFKEAHGEAEVATRSDLRELELKMENRFKELDVKIAETKSELIRWVVGAGFLQTALIAALLLKLIK